MKTRNLSKQVTTWSQLQHRVSFYPTNYPGSRTLLVLDTAKDNHMQAVKQMVNDLALHAANRGVKGTVSHNRLVYANGSEILVVGTHNLDYCRGYSADILVVPQQASDDVLAITLPALMLSVSPLLASY